MFTPVSAPVSCTYGIDVIRWLHEDANCTFAGRVGRRYRSGVSTKAALDIRCSPRAVKSFERSAFQASGAECACRFDRIGQGFAGGLQRKQERISKEDWVWPQAPSLMPVSLLLC